MVKIVILDGYTANPGDLGWEEFESLGDFRVYDRTEPEQIVERIGDAQIVLVNKVPLTAATFDACPSIRMAGVLATGYNVIDLDAARRHGVVVCNVPDYSTHAVAQMTVALLLEICQRVGEHAEAVREGQWCECRDFCFWNHSLTELNGKTLGIIGYGAIGRAVGRIAQALDMKLLVTARHEKPVPEGARFVSMEELLAQSDVVSLHCPQTAENLHFINDATLASMKDGAILINTARGGLVDEQAVAAALRSGKLRGYGADVAGCEPMLADNPLRSAPNCFITPHIAWAPEETRRRLLCILAQNIRAFLNGTPQNVVN